MPFLTKPKRKSKLSLKPFEVVVTPFPFLERASAKRRPALVLSAAHPFGEKIGLWVLAMITSAKHSAFPLDVALKSPESLGLKPGCMVRMKLFTLDERIFLKKIGSLAPQDHRSVKASLQKLFPYL